MLDLNFTSFPELATVQLILRQLKVTDDHEIFALRSDKRVNKYLDRPITKSIHEAREFIDKINNGIAHKEWLYWAISFKNEFKLIGTICYWNISNEYEGAEIGYELHPDFQGKGLMEEAISRVLEFGFEKIKFKTITAFLTEDNDKSVQVLQRNNFKMDSRLADKVENREKFSNTLTYSLTNSNWYPIPDKNKLSG